MGRGQLVATWCGLLVVVYSLYGMPLLAEDAGLAGPRSNTEPGGQPDADPWDSPDGQPSADPADVDNLLDLDVQQLAEADVLVATMTDPVVDAVSKTPEKSSESPGVVDVITAQDIEQFGAKNLYEVMRWATSVYMTGSFMYPHNVASIRGNLIKHEDNHVLILINGRPFRDTTLGGVNTSIYNAFPIHTIERIEVIRGPGSVLYGTNAFTGVINIVTKNPDQPTLHASVLSGSYGWQSYSLAGGNGTEQRGFYMGGTYSREDGWPFTATSEDPDGPDPAMTDTALYGQDNVGVFTMYRNGGFTANLFVANAVTDVLGTQPIWPSYKMDDPRVFVDLGYWLELDERQSIQLNFTYNYDGMQQPGFLSTADHWVPFFAPSHSFLLEGTYRAELMPDMNLMVGGTTDIHHGKGYMLPLVLVPKFDEIWYGVYMQLDYRVNEWLKLVGGMQANLPGEIEGGIVPRAGVIVSPTENWTAKFLYGQAFRSPYRLERYIDGGLVIQGNPDLAPETIQTFDVQIDYHTDDFRFATTYFHSDFFGVVTRVGTLPQTYVNQGRIEYQGVELENEWRLSQRWRWLGSLTYQDNVRDGVHNTTSVPNWMAKMGLVYHNNCSGWTVGLFDTFYGDPTLPATAMHVNPDPEAYHLVSLNMTLDLDRGLHRCTGRSMKLQFLVENLLNESIDHFEFERELLNSLPEAPGRTYYGGFTVAY